MSLQEEPASEMKVSRRRTTEKPMRSPVLEWTAHYRIQRRISTEQSCNLTIQAARKVFPSYFACMCLLENVMLWQVHLIIGEILVFGFVKILEADISDLFFFLSNDPELPFLSLIHFLVRVWHAVNIHALGVLTLDMHILVSSKWLKRDYIINV